MLIATGRRDHVATFSTRVHPCGQLAGGVAERLFGRQVEMIASTTGLRAQRPHATRDAQVQQAFQRAAFRAIHVDHIQAAARGNANVGRRPGGPPARDLARVQRRILHTVPGARMLARR